MLVAGIQQLVVANEAVEALIGTRFYPVLVPEDPTYPLATYQVISDVPLYTLAKGPTISKMRLQIDTWSGGAEDGSYGDVKAVQAAIRAVLQRYSGQLPDGTIVAGIFMINAIDHYEQDSRSFRTTTDYEIRYYPGSI